MYVTVRRYEGITDSKEVARRVQEGFLPLLRQTRGFVAYYFADAGDGVMISTGIFQDRAGADESNQRAGEWTRENLASLVPNAPQITEGEVVVQTGA